MAARDARGTRDVPMSNLVSRVTLDPIDSGIPRRTMVLRPPGSAHARRLLVEAALHYRKTPTLRKTLAERQKDQPPEAVAIAWTAQQRLHRTWARLEARKKRRTLIAVAAARELLGFC